MATLTEMVAAVVVQSSVAAFSHFGVTLEAPEVKAPAVVERVVARSPRQEPSAEPMHKTADCSDAPRPHDQGLISPRRA